MRWSCVKVTDRSRAAKTLRAALAEIFLKLNIHPDVAEALKSPSAPVVALESTLLAHGLPASIRLDAHQLEELVREHQAVPATIAIIDNEFCIGLNSEQLERLTQQESQKHPFEI